MTFCHDNKFSAHTGRDNTYHKVKESFYWFGMRQDIKVFVATCAACNKNKKPKKYRRAPQKTHGATYPFERLQVDILGPITTSNRGHTCILVSVCAFTRWVEIFALKDSTAETVAEVLVTEVFSRFGCPSVIHSDMGRNFTSNLFRSLCILLEINKTQTSPYRPQSNGITERMNRVLIEMIRCLNDEGCVADWDLYIPHVASAIRAIRNRHTGFTANRLFLGREISRPLNILYDLNSYHTPGVSSEGTYLMRFDAIIRKAHSIARKNLKGAFDVQKRNWDKNMFVTQYEKGDFVYRLRGQMKPGISPKLQTVYEGPYLVVDVKSPILIKIANHKRSYLIHHDRLKPCKDRFIPIWLRRKRQELLDLDEDLDTSDDDDNSFFLADSNIFRESNTVVAQNSEEFNEVDNEIQDIDDKSSLDEPVDSLGAVAQPSQILRKTRTGRAVKPNTAYNDYLFDW